MHVYRIAREKWIEDLSGKGAELAGGRWNHKGYPVVYTSCSLALCVCEILVHTDSDLPPADMRYGKIHIPDKLINRDLQDFDWSGEAKEMGTEWLKGQTSLALAVPSVVVPGEYNILINPLHGDRNKIKIENTEPFRFDPRFFSEREREGESNLDNILKFLS